MSNLLPPNATQLERLAAQALADIALVPVPIRDLLDPDRCPLRLLPYLAWAWSVDRWDPLWSEATKRSVIKAAYVLHCKKGTIGALRRVVEPLGYLIRVTEWFREDPPASRGTFRLDVGVLDTGITEEMFAELERLIFDAKPLSRHLTGLAINLEARGILRFAAAAQLGDELTVYPYTPEEIEVSGYARMGSATHLIDTLTVSQ